MTKPSRHPIVLWPILTLLSGCGGGGNSGTSLLGDSYGFVTPALGSRQIYTVTTTDNSSNTLVQTNRHTVTTVNADGSFVFVQDDPTGNSVTLNGTLYTIPTESISESNTGTTKSYTYTPTGSTTPVTCTYSTTSNSGGTSGYPLSVGKTWAYTYTVTCGTSTPQTFTETGGVNDIESVTVPAGTFTALKSQSTVSWTDAAGTTRTLSMTSWRDTLTSRLVKRVTNVAYSGTPLVNGYPVTTTTTLQSET